jgi:hypothetical protein
MAEKVLERMGFGEIPEVKKWKNSGTILRIFHPSYF